MDRHPTGAADQPQVRQAARAGGRPRLLVLSSTWPSGPDDAGPAFVRELTRRLTPWFDIQVLVPHAPGLPEHEFDGELEVRRYRYAPERMETLAYGSGIAAQLRERRWRWLLVVPFLLAQMWAIRRLEHRWRPDLIHAHWLLPQAVAAACAGARAPLACTCHGTDIFGFNGRLAGWLKRRAAETCVAIAVVSAGLGDTLQRRLPGAPLPAILPMGVDLRQRFVPDPAVPRRPQRLLFVGRLIDVKGVEVLLRAVAAVAAGYPQVALDIAGDGPLRAGLEALAHALGIADRVRFLGRVAQSALPDLYRRAGACVIPSVRTAQGHEEALGLVMIEALGCACPVVGSDLAGMSEVLRHGETALVFAAGQSLDLAQALRRLFEQPALAAQLADQGRAAVLRRFDWEPVAQGYAGWLGALLPPRLSLRMDAGAYRAAQR